VPESVLDGETNLKLELLVENWIIVVCFVKKVVSFGQILAGRCHLVLIFDGWVRAEVLMLSSVKFILGDRDQVSADLHSTLIWSYDQTPHSIEIAASYLINLNEEPGFFRANKIQSRNSLPARPLTSFFLP
jgi:hypothetical protein